MNAFDFLPQETPAAAEWPILGDKTPRAELAVQMAFRKLMKAIAPKVRIIAVPNGTHIASHAGRRKANLEGRSAGFPDLMALWSSGDARANVVPQVAFIEFKAGRAGILADTQVEWLTWLDDAGFACCASRNEHQAAEWIRSLGAPFVDRRGL